MIDRTHKLPVSRQCRLIDEIHLKYSFYGSRKIRDELRDRGFKIGRGQVRTLMQKMGIETLYQKPRLSEPHPGHKVYPYLLRGLEITRANQVWAADICYLPMARGHKSNTFNSFQSTIQQFLI